MAESSRSIVVVGGGPRGAGLVERLLANVPELLGEQRLDLHVVEPDGFGTGRIWRHDQAPLLWANSRAEDMTMFTDGSCTIEGPVRPGPTFEQWAADAAGAAVTGGRPRDGREAGPQAGLREELPAGPRQELREELRGEAERLHGMTFASRLLVHEYLAWFFWRTVHDLPPGVRLHLHRDRAIDLTEEDGRQLVHLAGRPEPLRADVVLLAQGHLGSRPVRDSAALSEVAARHGLLHLAEEFTADADLDVLPAGEPVLVRGAGLAFIDLTVLVTEGRGGRFVRVSDVPGKTLEYLPSGREPILHVGSRRGVPYRSKITYRLTGRPVPGLRFLDPVTVEQLLLLDRALDFRGDVWPLLAKELAFAHYFELFHSHPEAVTGSWDEFHHHLARLPWGSPELDEAVAAQVADPQDRLDLEAFDRPLRGLTFPDGDTLQRHVLAHVEADVARRADPRFSADLAVFTALLSVLEPLGRIVGSGRLSTASTVRDLPWFFGFFSYFASGPPPQRLEELLALGRAGLVRFVGPDVRVEVRGPRRSVPAAFVAHSPAVPGEVSATALVEARVPAPTVSATTDRLLLRLFDRGEVCEQVLVDDTDLTRIPLGRLLVAPDTCQVVDAGGRPHPQRYAFGSGTSAATPGAFSRPSTNAAFFRQNDAAARRVLAGLAGATRNAPPHDEQARREAGAAALSLPGEPAEVVYVRGGDAPLRTALEHLAGDLSARSSAPWDPRVDRAVLLRRDGAVLAVAGCTEAEDSGDTAELTALWVHPAHRGLGLARQALTALHDRVADAGVRRIRAATSARVPEARNLLAGAGYEPSGDRSVLEHHLSPCRAGSADAAAGAAVHRPHLTPARAS